jgi:uncharacterized protein YijF (DUF1287 family)
MVQVVYDPTNRQASIHANDDCAKKDVDVDVVIVAGPVYANVDLQQMMEVARTS